MKKIEHYSNKVEIHMEKISSVLDESESEFMNTVLSDDSQICADAMECCIDLKQLKKNIIKSKEEENSVDKSSLKTDSDSLADMQNIILSQMRQQQEFLDQQQNKIKEQEKRKALEKTSSVKLPKIDIVSYSGDRMRWKEFWDSFECTVHRNENLSGIEKFCYLRSKLSGEAALAVSGLALSNGNYDIAVDILNERFGNNQEAIDLHYNEIINMQSANNSTYSLRLFLDKIQRHLRSLEVLGQDINQDVFVSMVKAKLPHEVLLQIEIMNGAKGKWNTNRLIEKLHDYVVAREKSEIKSNPTESSVRPKGANYTANNTQGQNKGDKRPEFHTNVKSKEGNQSPHVSSAEALVAGSVNKSHVKNYFDRCMYCEKQHWSDECPTFRTVKERKQQLKDSCFKCLKTGHISKECKRGKVCVHCGELSAHHRSLCPKKFKQSNSSFTPHEVNALTEQSSSPNENALISSGEFVLMQTAKTEVRNPHNDRSVTVRLMLDSGSQRTYITENLAEQLNLKKTSEQEIKLVTFGSETPKVINTSTTDIIL